MYPDLGRLLHYQRQKLGLRTIDVATLADVAESQVSRYEQGISRPRTDVLERLARALQLSPADLFTLAGYAVPNTLPTLRPYLRTKYGLSSSAITEVEHYLTTHGIPLGSGPVDGEDEQPE